MKTIFVAGDLLVDHQLIKQDTTPSSYVDDPRIAVRQTTLGGAWYLARVVQMVCGELPETQIIGPPAVPTWQAAQAFSIWSSFPRSNDKPKETAWRIDKFLGCEPAAEEFIPGAPNATSPRDPFPDADVLVLEDLHLGFRDDPLRWPTALQDGGRPWRIVLKANAPPETSPLFMRLLEPKYADRLTVVVSVNALRERGAAISRGLSWDQTIEDLAREFESGASAYDLARCRRTIVYFPDGSAAASFTRCGLKLGPGDIDRPLDPDDGPLRTQATFERFLYLPDEVEGNWRAGIEGKLFGAGSIVTAAVVRHECDAKTYPIYLALGRALSAARHVIESGGQSSADNIQLDEEGMRGRLILESPEKGSPKNMPKPVDPAFAYYTAYPHEVLDDVRMQQPTTKSDLLRDVAGPTVEYMKAKAFEVVIEGADAALKAIPKARYQKYQTVDRQEIERINAVRSLIAEYRRNRSDTRPLSIAVFGQPGSGKSFAIKQLAVSLFGNKNPVLEFNLSQFAGDRMYQLHQAFHRVRDESIKGLIPLVFWDEFDADNLDWLKHFLAPMQDAEFRSGSDVHAFGRAIFVFAGGTKPTFAEFDRSDLTNPEHEPFRDRKGPDFVSRLRGYIDIKGPNPTKNNPNEDPAYVIRRAMILRSTLEQTYGQLIDSKTKLAHIDAAIVHAFLNVERFVHGARSILSLLSMCQLNESKRFGMAQLNAPNLLEMHVSSDLFKHVHEAVFDVEVLQAFSQAAHDGWVEARKRLGWTRGEVRDDVAMTDPALKPFAELSSEEQASNHSVARVMTAKLNDIGYRIVRQPPFGVPTSVKLTTDERNQLARHEHDRWLREQLIKGFEYAPATNKSLRQHRDLAPFDQLGPDEQKLDLVVSEILPRILAKHMITLERNTATLRPTDALVIVDVQNDFCAGGALPVEEADQIIPVLNHWIEAARANGAKVVATRDWHPPGHVSFQERGGPWPVHCVQNTWGAEFRQGLNLPADTQVFSKGASLDSDQFSGFAGTCLADWLRRSGVRRLWIGGLAQDVCVRATVLDGIQDGFKVHLIKAGTRAVNAEPGDGERALDEMRTAGCIIESGNHHV